MLDPFRACSKATSSRSGEHIVRLEHEAPRIEPYSYRHVEQQGTSCEMPSQIRMESKRCETQEAVPERRMWDRPQPIELSEAWVCVPRSFRSFQRCHICVDKLGVSLRPLIEADKLPSTEEVLWRGAVSAQNDASSMSQTMTDLELLTETIMLPLSSCCDLVESSEQSLTRLMLETDFAAGTLLHKGPFARPRLEIVSHNLSAVSREGSGDVDSDLSVQHKSSGSNSRATGMMDRLYGDGDSSNGKAMPSSDCSRQRKHVEPPYPNLVGIYVKGALACINRSRRSRKPDGGRSCESEAEKLKEQGATSSGETVMVAICFKTALDGQRLIARVRDFKRYALALTFSTFLDNLSGAPCAQKPCAEDGRSYIQQEAFEWGLQPKEVDEVLSALQPPPQQDPNFDRKIPTMKLEDDGRVFWLVPKKKAPLLQRGATLMRFNSFQ